MFKNEKLKTTVTLFALILLTALTFLILATMSEAKSLHFQTDDLTKMVHMVTNEEGEIL